MNKEDKIDVLKAIAQSVNMDRTQFVLVLESGNTVCYTYHEPKPEEITTTVISTTTSLSTRKAAQHNEQQELRMISLDIAELCGKQHRHVMEAIRKMEPAWVKVHGSKFRLMFREVTIGHGAVRQDPSSYKRRKGVILTID